MFFTDSNLVTYLGRYKGIVGCPKNHAYLLLVPILYHVFNIENNKRPILNILLLLAIIGLTLTGSFTGYLGLSVTVMLYITLSSNIKKDLIKRSIIGLLLLVLTYWFMFTLVDIIPSFSGVRTRIDNVLMIYSNRSLDFNTILINSNSVTNRIDELNTIPFFLKEDSMTILFGTNINEIYTRGEIYYYTLLHNKGITFLIVYLGINFYVLNYIIKFFIKNKFKLGTTPKRLILIVLPFLIFNVFIANFIESFTERRPINSYYYAFVGLVVGLIDNFQRLDREDISRKQI